MKYFRHILMGHEILLKIFDGLQSIFWCSFLILTFSKFISKFMWVWAENVQAGHQEHLRKIRHVKQQIRFLQLHDNMIHFDPVTRVSDLSDGLQDTPLHRFFFSRLIYMIPFVSRIVWIDKLHNLMKRFSPNNGCHGNKKKISFNLS